MSLRPAVFRHLLAMLAVLAYTANGAQTHLKFERGETLHILVCGDGASRLKAITLGGGEPAEHTPHTCCGDCTPAPALAAASPAPLVLLSAAAPEPPALRSALAPRRSPLWPGAPPQGPPLSA